MLAVRVVACKGPMQSLVRNAGAMPHVLPNAGGRYLSDTWALNLDNLTWRAFPSSSSKVAAAAASEGSDAAAAAPPVLPAIAGHVAVPWGGNVVLVGGHMKVRCLPASWFPASAVPSAAGGCDCGCCHCCCCWAAIPAHACAYFTDRTHSCAAPLTSALAGQGGAACDACAAAGHEERHLVCCGVQCGGGRGAAKAAGRALGAWGRQAAAGGDGSSRPGGGRSPAVQCNTCSLQPASAGLPAH